MKPRRTCLMEQDQALDTYFDSLLIENDITQYSGVEPRSKQNSKSQSTRHADDEVDKKQNNNGSAKIGPDIQAYQRSDFLALFFNVDNFLLATPLQDLSRTIDLPKEFARFPNQPVMVIGYLQDKHDHIALLDTSALFTNGNRRAIQQRDTKLYRKALIIRDSHWGIPCDGVSSVVKLTSAEIQWRRSRVNKPWLLGTATDQLRSLIDLNRLIAHQSFT